MRSDRRANIRGKCSKMYMVQEHRGNPHDSFLLLGTLRGSFCATGESRGSVVHRETLQRAKDR